MSRDADMGNGERVIATLEHSDERLDGSYKGRADAVGKCARGAKQFDENNFPYFVFHSFLFLAPWSPLRLCPRNSMTPSYLPHNTFMFNAHLVLCVQLRGTGASPPSQCRTAGGARARSAFSAGSALRVCERECIHVDR